MFGKKQFTYGCDNAPHFISKEILYAVTIGFEKKIKKKLFANRAHLRSSMAKLIWTDHSKMMGMPSMNLQKKVG